MKEQKPVIKEEDKKIIYGGTKKMRITKSQGLINSIIVLEHLRDIVDNERHNSRSSELINIGCFTNCRECGYTFMCFAENGEMFTFCVYEHRNSDQIIINGREGCISMNGDLPYCADNKYTYLASFPYNQHYECAKELFRRIRMFMDNNQRGKNY